MSKRTQTTLGALFSLRQDSASSRGNRLRRCITAEWLRRRLTRRGPGSNRCERLCRPLPNHSATAPVREA